MADDSLPRDELSFMSYRGQSVYISICTRPDITYALKQLTRTKPSEADDPDFKRLDQIFKRLKENQYELRYGNVDLKTAEVLVFSNRSFANNKDLFSQNGYIILLLNEKHNCSILSWSFTKFKRVTTSVLAAELYAIAHVYDAGFIMAYTVGKLLNRPMKIRVLTDSRTLFDYIAFLCVTAEKRLRKVSSFFDKPIEVANRLT